MFAVIANENKMGCLEGEDFEGRSLPNVVRFTFVMLLAVPLSMSPRSFKSMQILSRKIQLIRTNNRVKKKINNNNLNSLNLFF